MKQVNNALPMLLQARNASQLEEIAKQGNKILSEIKPPTENEITYIANFSNLSNVSYSQSAILENVSYDNTFENAIKLTASENGTVLLDYPINAILEGGDIVLEFDVNTVNFSEIVVFLISSSGNMYSGITSSRWVAGKNLIRIKYSDWILAGALKTDIFTTIRIRINSALTNATIITLGDVKLVKGTKPCVIFTFDDISESQYRYLYSIFKSKNKVGCLSVINSLIDNSSCMSDEQLKDFQSIGFELLNHSIDNTSLITLSEMAAINNINNCNLTLKNNYFNASRKIVVYPIGAYNKRIQVLLKNSGYIGARIAGSSNGIKLPLFGYEKYQIPAIDFVSYANAKTYVDNALLNKECVVFLSHVINSTLAQDISNMLDYLDEIGIEVVTISSIL